MTFSVFRKFDGLKFHMTVRKGTKREAVAEANWFRKKGYRVRVVKGKSQSPLGSGTNVAYYIYTRAGRGQ